MATTDAEAVLVDTNVLLDATNLRRPHHRAALDVIEGRPGLVMCAQVAREYLVVATRPPSVNGLGLAPDDALDNLEEPRSAIRMLPEETPVLPELLSLLRQVPCRGRIIHDAFLVATMRAHRVRKVITGNPADFERFGDWVDVEPLGADG